MLNAGLVKMESGRTWSCWSGEEGGGVCGGDGIGVEEPCWARIVADGALSGEVAAANSGWWGWCRLLG